MAQTYSKDSASQPSDEWLAARIATLLSHYYQPEQEAALTAAAATDWLDLLGNLPQFAIEHACRQYLKNQPTRRPTPGSIRNMALSEMERRQKRAIPKRLAPPEPDPKPTPEEKARVGEIVRRAGFTAQRAAALKAAPMARTDEELSEAATRVPHWSEGLPADHPKMQELRAARLKAGTIAE